ncbi:hypothetical protein B0H12DRAFT_330503 [Mycena haematopus]|nr:hypothetical protein B0H12DRAFT_330503 [Mycena haematopus]
MCFPPKEMGPDLLFVLELADGKRIWVAVQCKYETTDLLASEKLESALRTVTPENYFSSQKDNQKLTHKYLLELPNRQTEKIGDYSVLRVVASFPGVTALKPGPFKKSRRQKGTLESMKHWKDAHPLASLNILYLANITKDMSPRNGLTSIDNAPKPIDSRSCGRKKGAPRSRLNNTKSVANEEEEDEDEEDEEWNSSRLPAERRRSSRIASGSRTAV